MKKPTRMLWGSYVLLSAIILLGRTPIGAQTIVGWGFNVYGQQDFPEPPAGIKYIAIAAGFTHSLALMSDGNIIARGSNIFGECDVPALPPGIQYTKIACGAMHSLALRSDGTAIQWGNLNAASIPAPPTGITYIDLAGGYGANLLLRSDGNVVVRCRYCTGYETPPALPTGVIYTAVAATLDCNHYMALRSDGKAVNWGRGSVDIYTPPAGTTYTGISGGQFHILLLRSDGNAESLYGFNLYGECNIPALPPGITYTAVAGGGFHSIALRSDGSIIAWGYNGSGQLNVPELPFGTKYTAIASGVSWGLALRTGGVAPIAIAGPDQNIILGELIQFDGSQSSDPDGSITSFAWDFGDGVSAQGAIAGHMYMAAGIYSVTLTVTDDTGIGTADTAVVRVLTFGEAIDSLIGIVASFNLQQGISNSLDTKLANCQNALTAANAGNRQDAANKLYGFINEVEAQRNVKITSAQADQLITEANRIISLLQS